MPNAAQLAERITVRHREPGYLCLDLPAILCAPTVAADLVAALETLKGVAGAHVLPRPRQLTVRYDAATLTTAQVARHLFDAIDALPEETPADEAPADDDPLPVASLQPLLDKIKALLLPAETPPPGSLQARMQPMVESALTEKAVTNFVNDIVAFYLIKVHWDLITKRWLTNPLAHSNAWLTTFYLVFLLIRYRKSQ